MSLAQPDCTAKPKTLTPREEYSFSSLLNSGISLTQFSHHVAQKSRTTILSLRSSERSVRPSSCDSENCGTESGCWPAVITNRIQIRVNTFIGNSRRLQELHRKSLNIAMSQPTFRHLYAEHEP